MQNRKTIADLQKALGHLRDVMTGLEGDISELAGVIRTGEWIPDSLCGMVMEKLKEIETGQKEFAERFSTLKAGTLPSRIADVCDMLDRWKQRAEDRDRYIKAVCFFLTLHSDEEATQELLEKRKSELTALDFSEMDEQEIKEVAGSYVWLFDAYHEPVPEKRFSLIYKLAPVFEEPIAMGIQFGTLKSLAPEDVETVCDADVQGEAACAEEESKENAQEEETQEEEAREESSDDLWQAVGIEQPEGIVAKEDRSLREEVSLPERTKTSAGGFLEGEKEEQDSVYRNMLISRKFYAATAYVKALSKEDARYETVYRQLSYALNDPMGGCGYHSDRIFEVFYGEESPLPGHYAVAAALRNYFLDQFCYDHSLQQLQMMLAGNPVLREEPVLNRIAYTLLTFKTDYHRGIDRYADYREKARVALEVRLEELKREAQGYYANYSENAPNKQVVETGKLLFGPGSDLSEYLKILIDDNREMTELLEGFLKERYVKDQAEVGRENIDPEKVDAALDEHWDLAGQKMKISKKRENFAGSLRMHFFKRTVKIVGVLCEYVFWLRSAMVQDDDPALREYKKIRVPLLKDMDDAMKKLSESGNGDPVLAAGNAVLIETLREMKARLEGTYQEEEHRYFYINFLRSDQVLLDEDYLPILEDVPELPELSAKNRILEHDRSEEKEWYLRLYEISNKGDGGDDYGSAGRILQYLRERGVTLSGVKLQEDSLEEAVLYPQEEAKDERSRFVEDVELAQSYGKIDNTVENSKEAMLQIVDAWFSWANETKNYGFFKKILKGFRRKIEEDARLRGVELKENLNAYLEKNADWEKDDRILGVVSEVRNRIEQQNYAAAEDLFNRLLMNDLELNLDPGETDHLAGFLDEYEINYRKTAAPGVTLMSLVDMSRINKDTKGAHRLLESWPKKAGVGESSIRSLLTALGFAPDTVRAEPLIQDKIESYFVVLKRPQNGRKSNYTHPIAAFGSEAEEKGFRVVCLFGKTDASRLIDTFREIGNARNTIVFLDYALTLADRRSLARKTKKDLSGKTFAVIDRVVLLYLAKHYAETAVNRMLMSLIMPFASYQPYIIKSADIMPQEIFIGRKQELEKIESPTGVNIVYGGRQLGKTALLRMAKKDIDRNENKDRAVIVNALEKDYRETAKAVSEALYDEGILKKENVTEDWDELARDIKNRLRDKEDEIPYFLLMIDEADAFIESCEAVGYQPFNALKDIQSIGSGRFKFVVAGLRNIVRFKRMAALSNNSVLAHLDSLTVKPFKSMEARELLEGPLSYLGFRFRKDDETEVLISTIFGTTNYFPGLIQLYGTKLIETMKRDYAGYSESETPPYYVQEAHIKRALADQTLQEDIRKKFFITLRVGADDYYYIIALLIAYHYHQNKSQNGCDASDLLELAKAFSVKKLVSFGEDGEEKLGALMEEMQELNVLQHVGGGRYRFTRHNFCQMMGTEQQIDDELMNYMED